jgi:hypothetical protein
LQRDGRAYLPIAKNLNAPVAIFNAFVPADLAPVSTSSEHDTDMSEMWDPMVVDRTSQQLVRRRKRRRLDDPPLEVTIYFKLLTRYVESLMYR